MVRSPGWHKNLYTMTRQKSSGSQPAPGPHRHLTSQEMRAGVWPGRGQGKALAPPSPENGTPARSTIGRSGHGGLWGGPRLANQGPRGAHSFTKNQQDEARNCLEL